MSIRSARLRDAQLIPVVLSAWAAALWGIAVPETAGSAAIAAWLAAVAAMAASLRAGAGRGRRTCAVAVIATACAAAVLSHIALAQPGRTATAVLELQGGRAVEVTAIVTGKIEPGGFSGLRFDALALTLSTGATQVPVSIPVTIDVAPEDVDRRPLLDVGALIVARGTAAGTVTAQRAALGVHASQGVDVAAGPTGPLLVASRLRHGLLTAVEGLPMPAAGLIAGLAVGDTSAVTAELDSAMKQSSLSHLTAVSGANCALVVALAFGLGAAAGAPRALRVLLALVALSGFVLLVTPEPSVVRAAVMAAAAMLAVLLGRPGAGLSVLCLAIIAILVADPWMSASLGFALSAAATGSLLLLAPRLARGLGRWMPRPLALIIAVPLAAQIACGPLLILIAPTIPLYGVAANILAAPAAPVATIVGLAACLAGPIPVLQSGLAALAWLPAAWIAATAQSLSMLPGASQPWLDGWGGAVALAVVGAAIAIVVCLEDASRRTRAAPAMASGLLAALLGMGTGASLLAGILAPITVPPHWSIAACDVGQGDAILVRSAGRIGLIDTGPDPAALTSCLARFGVTRVDLLVLTHFDLDHVGGVASVIGRAEFVLHGPVVDADARHIIADLQQGGAMTSTSSAGQHGVLGDARWEVLWPPARTVAFPGGNNASVVLDFRGGDLPTSLFLGDLSASPQRALRAQPGPLASYDVVKVAHHGSADQNPDLYRETHPAVALVTVGVDNDYGHPREEILDVLLDLGAVIARTDLSGAIALTRTAEGVDVWRERDPPDVVDPR